MGKIDINKKYKTRSGLTVELISVKGREPYPVVGYMGGVRSIMVWTEYGFWTGCPGANDLVEVKKTETRYQFIYQHETTKQCFMSSGFFSLLDPPNYDDEYVTIGPYAPSAKEFEVD